MNQYTSFLFYEPSLLEGAASIFDWSDQYGSCNASETASEADRKALCADMISVFQDLWDASAELKQQELLREKTASK